MHTRYASAPFRRDPRIAVKVPATVNPALAGLIRPCGRIHPMLKRIIKYSLILLAAIAVLIVAGGVYARSQIRASLPQVDGTATIANLTANVRVDRDA